LRTTGIRPARAYPQDIGGDERLDRIDLDDLPDLGTTPPPAAPASNNVPTHVLLAAFASPISMKPPIGLVD
jgi:hypothetical protein